MGFYPVEALLYSRVNYKEGDMKTYNTDFEEKKKGSLGGGAKGGNCRCGIGL
jgi:hypothetical protein